MKYRYILLGAVLALAQVCAIVDSLLGTGSINGLPLPIPAALLVYWILTYDRRKEKVR